MSKSVVALVGNPNCGKSTLFNAITGGNAKVGNWPGVTVEKTSGEYCFQDLSIEVVDLPGTYSLATFDENHSIDVKIACEYLLSGKVDVVVNVIDATNLERNLFLTSQLLEMNIPVIVALNMSDIAQRRGIEIDTKVLSESLSCPVIRVVANKDTGIAELKHQIVQSIAVPDKPTIKVTYPKIVVNATEAIISQLNDNLHPNWLALRLLEGDWLAQKMVDDDICEYVKQQRAGVETISKEETDILIADARFTWANAISKKVLNSKKQNPKRLSYFIDNIILHRLFGIPIFLGVMYLMFLFAINFGICFQDFFDLGSQALFIDGSKKIFTYLHFPNWLTVLLSDGVGRGINTTITFIPVLACMFFFLAVLESSGYMARAAFVVDRLMRMLGLPGKSFVPMIVGFGCNVPAIMAARTLEHKRDQVLTVMMSPFMSCGARLAIYAVFTAAFFPVGGQNIVFSLYLIGVLMAVFTGLILRNTLLRGEASDWVVEMPPYHVPRLKLLFKQTWFRLKNFLWRAGKIIVIVCMLLSFFHNLTPSILESAARFVTPFFAPMGISQDNWPASIGLAAGVLSKEVVVATLNTLYSQVGHLSDVVVAQTSIGQSLVDAFKSIPANLSEFTQTLGNPIAASAPSTSAKSGIYGVMAHTFGSQLAAFSYLLFVLLYFPCVSATAAIARELNKGWAAFSVLWTTGIAYAIAVLFYQLATIPSHVLQSSFWVIGVITSIWLTIYTMRRYANKGVQVC